MIVLFTFNSVGLIKVSFFATISYNIILCWPLQIVNVISYLVSDGLHRLSMLNPFSQFRVKSVGHGYNTCGQVQWLPIHNVMCIQWMLDIRAHTYHVWSTCIYRIAWWYNAILSHTGFMTTTFHNLSTFVLYHCHMNSPRNHARWLIWNLEIAQLPSFRNIIR